MTTGTFDARVVRKNDSEKGLFITLEITGDDFYGAVSQFRPGTLLKLQYEELDGDTGAPVQKGGDANTTPTTTETTAHAPIRQRHGEPERNNTPPHAEQSATHGAKPRRPFSDLPLSQQCAIRCGDKQFWKYWEHWGGEHIETEQQMVAAVRCQFGIDSRSEIDRDSRLSRFWRMHEDQFQSWLTTQAHADNYR